MLCSSIRLQLIQHLLVHYIIITSYHTIGQMKSNRVANCSFIWYITVLIWSGISLGKSGEFCDFQEKNGNTEIYTYLVSHTLTGCHPSNMQSNASGYLIPAAYIYHVHALPYCEGGCHSTVCPVEGRLV